MYKNWEDKASFGDFIISYLLSCNSRRIQRKTLYELVQKRRVLSKQVFNNNLYRLEKNGLVSFDYNKDVIFNKNTLTRHTLFTKIKESPKDHTKVMVLFDIPEKKRKTRNWLRIQLKLWGFKMIQQSVWLGKGPLPKEFAERLDLLGISKCVKVLKVQTIKS